MVVNYTLCIVLMFLAYVFLQLIWNVKYSSTTLTGSLRVVFACPRHDNPLGRKPLPGLVYSTTQIDPPDNVTQSNDKPQRSKCHENSNYELVSPH
ncbi:hypothetical protein PI125_g26155 [Phytophthora idaei]|nr:hypothetical protein PI125_g26155 [Phytophthora idaei]